jgi:hypothetical protein
MRAKGSASVTVLSAFCVKWDEIAGSQGSMPIRAVSAKAHDEKTVKAVSVR